MKPEKLADVDKNIGKKSKDKEKKKKSAKVGMNYAKEVVAELKKVTWPDKKDVVKATGVVIAIAITFGVIVGAFDYLFSTLIGLLVG